MRRVWMCGSVFLAIAGLAWSQALTEAAGAIAGGSAGSVAGKKVSDGISSVLQKVDATAGKAAKTGAAPGKAIEKAGEKSKDSAGTVLQVGPGGVVKDHSLVPPPPVVRRAATVPPPPPAAVAAIAPIMPVAPQPPPAVTAEDLKSISGGTSRSEVLKLGAPAARISMYEEGHLVEIYHYQSHDRTVGAVRLRDGSVSSVQVQ